MACTAWDSWRAAATDTCAKDWADGFFDVHNYIALCRDHYVKVGLGRDYVDHLFR
ncbi:hypothetical protein [Ensifer adhaerens]|uniref:hypothetical protein n=1 Tax=Ensifer adhaerens TaxID=106592 RepID=UPI002119CDF1|nr:hypothetical protein [Ensifer adhaerens]